MVVEPHFHNPPRIRYGSKLCVGRVVVLKPRPEVSEPIVERSVGRHGLAARFRPAIYQCRQCRLGFCVFHGRQYSRFARMAGTSYFRPIRSRPISSLPGRPGLWSILGRYLGQRQAVQRPLWRDERKSWSAAAWSQLAQGGMASRLCPRRLWVSFVSSESPEIPQ